jgi:DNA-binding NarL/FixJ family response regulator
MPGASPRDGIAKLLSLQPGLAVVVVSGSANLGEMEDIFELGVAGVITKVTEGAVVEAAIRLVLAGGRCMAPEMFRRKAALVQPAPPPHTQIAHGLTKTQVEVIRHLVDGKTNKEIAKQLAIAPSTVNSHLDQIFKRLGAANRTDACHRYLAMQSTHAP